ncbi:MAG: glycosyltransferase [Chloroflexi bacterium]|nr:MAG: glycosyltransferase [Chloroflexota bacterium]
MATPRVRVLGVGVDVVDMESALDAVVDAACTPRPGAPLHVVTLNPEIVMRARRDPALGAIIEAAGLVVPDGIGVVLALRRRGQPGADRVAGADLLESYAERAASRGQRLGRRRSRRGDRRAAARRGARRRLRGIRGGTAGDLPRVPPRRHRRRRGDGGRRRPRLPRRAGAPRPGGGAPGGDGVGLAARAPALAAATPGGAPPVLVARAARGGSGRGSATGGLAVLSLVVPAYNEADRLPPSLVRMREHLDASGEEYELIVVDDGSSDGTAAAVERATEGWPQLRLLRLERNQGKGAATRAGMLAARGEHRAFSDADLSTPLEELPRLRAHLDGDCQVAIASRAGDAQIEVHQDLRRELMGKTYNVLLRILVLPGIRDSQCGFKVFEVPVRWRHVEASRVHPLRDASRMLLDLVLLRFRRL